MFWWILAALIALSLLYSVVRKAVRDGNRDAFRSTGWADDQAGHSQSTESPHPMGHDEVLRPPTSTHEAGDVRE